MIMTMFVIVIVLVLVFVLLLILANIYKSHSFSLVNRFLTQLGLAVGIYSLSPNYDTCELNATQILMLFIIKRHS